MLRKLIIYLNHKKQAIENKPIKLGGIKCYPYKPEGKELFKDKR